MYKIVAQAIKGFKSLRPSKKRTKKPLNIVILRKLWPFISQKSYTRKLIAAVLCLAYWYGLRVSEYAATNKDIRIQKRVHLKHEHIRFLYKNSEVIEATVTIPKSKCIQTDENPEKVSYLCTCPGVCDPHTLYTLIETQKAKNFQTTVLTQTKKHKYITPAQVNNSIKHLINKIKLPLDGYSSHSARIRRCVDWIKLRTDRLLIMKWDRWKSNCWEKHYALINFRDLATISHKPLQALGYELTT